MNKTLLSLLIGVGSCFLLPENVMADSLYIEGIARRIRPNIEQQDRVQAFADTLVKLRAGLDKQLLQWDDIYLQREDVLTSPDYYKLIVPATYYSGAVLQSMSIEDWKPRNLWDNRHEYKIPIALPNVESSKTIDQWINRQLLSFYRSYPGLVVQNEENLKALEPLANELRNVKEKKENLIKLMQTQPAAEVSESDLVVYKPNFWTKGGSGYLQFSQNSISSNWYKGGESTISFLSGFTYQANYDDKRNVQWENRFEWKLGFITAPSDTLHAYKANNDLVRISSKLGYKALKNWYYTISAEFKTQVFSNFATNSNQLISSLLSPAELNVGLGMDFKYVKDGKANLSVLMNPFNYTRYSVLSDEVDPTKFNIEAGRKSASVWGSRVEATMKWKLMKSLMWESRLSYITNYQKVMSEWENTFTFSFNKYLSTKLFLHGRFDDGVSKKGKWGYLQYQELLSFGLNFAW